MTTTVLDPEAIRRGATIREMRTMRGLTQDELSRSALISRAYLANLEAGRKIATGRVVARLAKALDVAQISIIRPDQVDAA